MIGLKILVFPVRFWASAPELIFDPRLLDENSWWGFFILGTLAYLAASLFEGKRTAIGAMLFA